ncbi:hypothetical protein SCLCIDRAFT_769809 [Scleroderma citrinum Foug A]|uniref:Uncharacterized protein n=1 Tax=Scleroderma citrinum Foug A TaxID=1036808 RepID=A0A0C3E572_9AGAM|nr:hypothetical protein SCLCIDRAFT_769809 [Scleroderma citrinum Foug A]
MDFGCSLPKQSWAWRRIVRNESPLAKPPPVALHRPMNRAIRWHPRCTDTLQPITERSIARSRGPYASHRGGRFAGKADTTAPQCMWRSG